MSHNIDYKTPVKQQVAILTFTFFYFIRWFVAPMSAIEWAVNVGAFVIFLPLYFVCFNVPKLTLWSSVFLVFLSVLVAPFNFGANCFAIYACSFFAYTQPTKRALVLCFSTVAIMLTATLLLKLDFISYFVVGTVIIIGLSASGIIDRQRILLQQSQRKSQQEIARLAKIAERERISQDLHDVIGHSLTAINLKSQLAIKLIENQQHSNALTQIQQIQFTAQTALKEIRETLAGLTKIGLEAELEAQKDFLQSLGLHFSYSLPQVTLPVHLESDLLLIIRESITNIVRHSNADTCSVVVTLASKHLEVWITDNGKGIQPNQPRGQGLTGIEQRVAKYGGQVTFANQPGLHTHIQIPWRQNEALDSHFAG